MAAGNKSKQYSSSLPRLPFQHSFLTPGACSAECSSCWAPAPLTWGFLMLRPEISNEESHCDFWLYQARIHFIKLLLTFEMSLCLNYALNYALSFFPPTRQKKTMNSSHCVSKENIKSLTAASQQQTANWSADSVLETVMIMCSWLQSTENEVVYFQH